MKNIDRLREENDRLRKELAFSTRLINAVRDGLWHRDLSTGHLWISPQWGQPLGYSKEDLPTNFEELLKLIDPLDHVCVRAAADRHLRGETAEYDCTFGLWSRKHNGYRIMRSRGVADHDARHLAGTDTDITELQQGSEKMRKSLKMFELIFANIPHLIVVKNREGEFLFGNKAILNFYGEASLASFVGKMDKHYNKNKKEVAAFLRDDRWVIEHRRVLLIAKEQNHDSKGKRHWLSTIKAPLVNDDGTVDVVVAATFIDDVIALENRLETTRQRNRRHREMAGLAKQLSHKLGTRILTLENAVELLPSPDEGRKEAVFNAIEDVKRFSEDFEKLGAATRLEFKSGNLVATLKHALDPHQVSGVEITLNGQPLRTLRADDSRFDLIADHRKLGDVFDELASNSVRWRKLGNPHRITIQIKREEPPSGPIVGMMGMMMYVPAADLGLTRAELRIVFEDNGPGINKTLRAKIFEPFVSGRSEGSGLGLAIVKEVIEAHGGKIALTSAPGAGARFEITVPIDLNKQSK